MTLIDFLILAVVAAICGMIGEPLVGYSIGGCVVSAVIGYIGAFIGLVDRASLRPAGAIHCDHQW